MRFIRPDFGKALPDILIIHLSLVMVLVVDGFRLQVFSNGIHLLINKGDR